MSRPILDWILDLSVTPSETNPLVTGSYTIWTASQQGKQILHGLSIVLIHRYTNLLKTTMEVASDK